ncbi:MAG: DHA2 family efflux MFS transporter permease subunit [Solirubrobacterales bacterium]|nr:DHA2 family efflux MFS transporter permease subunit [Solirubrobacterales bacterium]
MTRYRHLITEDNRKWWTLGAMCFALFMIMLDNTVVNVALPSIQRDLGASLSGLEWTINGFTLSFAVLLATGGRLGDIFGRRRGFIFGVTVFTLSSAAAGLSTEIWMLVAARVVQGVGAAFMMPATLSIITDAFPARERGRAIGTWAGVSALALAVGPVVGGFLTENVSWQSIFYLNVPVGIGAVVASVFAVRESRDTTVGREVDYLGVLTLTGSLTALVLALVEGNSWGWGSPAIVSLIAGSILIGALFILVELRVKAPMVEFGLFRDRTFIGATVVAFVVTFSMLGMFFFLALYMQDILGYSPLEAGIRFLPTTLMIVIIAPLSGRLTDRIGARWPITAGLSIVAASLYLQTQITTTTEYIDLLPAFILMGAGIALVMSPMSTAAMNAVSTNKAGIASGLLSMSRMVGGSFGVAATGALFQSKAGDLNPARLGSAPEQAKETFVHALSSSMRLSTAVAAAGAVIAVSMIRSGSQAQAEDSQAAKASAPARSDTATGAEFA